MNLIKVECLPKPCFIRHTPNSMPGELRDAIYQVVAFIPTCQELTYIFIGSILTFSTEKLHYNNWLYSDDGLNWHSFDLDSQQRSDFYAGCDLEVGEGEET